MLRGRATAMYPECGAISPTAVFTRLQAAARFHRVAPNRVCSIMLNIMLTCVDKHSMEELTTYQGR